MANSLISIQVLRAVAALAVLIRHIAGELGRLGFSGLPDTSIGAAGVDLFFVISGFVIVYSSDPLFGTRRGPTIFACRRLARIAPLYWMLSAILTIFFLLEYADLPSADLSLGSLIASFLFVPYPRPSGAMFPVHALGWTINYEVFFYALFAVAVVLPRRRAVAAMVAVLSVLVATNWLIALTQPLAFWCAPLILEFGFGMLIALAYRGGLRLPPVASYGLIALAAAAYIASAIVGHDDSWHAITWGLPAAALVGALVLSKTSARTGIITRALSLLGDASYSIYLAHPIVIAATKRGLVGHVDLPAWSWALLLFILSISAAILLFYCFERPITRALQRRISNYAQYERNADRGRHDRVGIA